MYQFVSNNATMKGHHIEQLAIVLYDVTLFLENKQQLETFVVGLPRPIFTQLKILNNPQLLTDSQLLIKELGLYMLSFIETQFREYDDDDFIGRTWALEAIQKYFPNIYSFSQNGGSFERCEDYKYILTTYMRHLTDTEGSLFLKEAKFSMPSDVYNTLVDISKDI